MKYPSLWLKNNRSLLLKILDFADKKKVKLYLVGGVLRDILLEREKDNPDIDFCIKGNAIKFSKALAHELKCGFVVLDQEHGCGRIVKKGKENIYTLDFSDYRGKTIEDDLFHRDLTINSMALELDKIFEPGSFMDHLIDPYQGRKDLRKKTIRMVNKDSFDEDPLRILRVFSYAALFGFKIEKQTIKLAGLKKKLILNASWERMRDEIFKTLSAGKSYEYIRQLDKQGILVFVFPEINSMNKLRQGPYHHLDVWAHSLETLKQMEPVLKNYAKIQDPSKYINTEISSGHKRYELLKLAALLHDVGKPATFRVDKGKVKFYGHDRVGSRILEVVAKRLKLSSQEERFLRQVTLFHLRPGFMANASVLTKKAKFRFFRDCAEEAVSVLLVSLADQRATKGYLTIERCRKRHERLVRRLIKEYFDKQKETKPERLIDGNDLMRNFKIEPSPLIGKLLRELEELQATGRIHTQEDALREAKKMLTVSGAVVK
ncbi:HD domain-containing protein [bacterium]|nr:MAG: HD domain-containing protein [bacterium]